MFASYADNVLLFLRIVTTDQHISVKLYNVHVILICCHLCCIGELEIEHLKCFPNFGEIQINKLMVFSFILSALCFKLILRGS